MELYPWLVLLHIVGAFLFVVAHGASVWAAAQIRRETHAARIAALLDLSRISLTTAYVGLLLLLVGGIWAGIVGNWFGRLWIWAALVLLVATAVGMYAIATPHFAALRQAVGQRTMRWPKDAPDPTPLPDADLAALAARTPFGAIAGVGFGGLVVILWLMVVKPF